MKALIKKLSLRARRLGLASLRAPVQVARKAERGMTLVEIMVVVIIIGLVSSVVGVAVFGQLEKAKISTARTQMKNISEALELYKLSFHNYPSTGEGLNALVAPKSGKPIMETVPKDPWDSDYVYIYPGTNNQGRFDLMSYGPDRVQGGGDDITNWGGEQAGS